MTTGVFSILGFVAKLGAIERDMKLVDHAIVAKACEMVCEAAKAELGTYQPGWPQLQPETIARKMRGDSPLLETGELRDSIGWNSSGNEGHVGSNNDKAVWHELGTSRIPARPFLMTAAMQQEDKIHKMAAKAVHAVLGGKGLHSSEMAELIHLLKHVGHAVKEAVDTLLEPDDDKNGKRR